MSGDLIVMSETQLTYAVGLVADFKRFDRAPSTFEKSTKALTDFLAAHDGEYLGDFEQDGMKYPEHAVVKMTKDTERALHDRCVADLHDPDRKPFVERILGEAFDISLRDGMKILSVEAELNRRMHKHLVI